MMTAWQYGLLPPLTGQHCPPEYAWAEDCEREMALQVALWNTLIQIENARSSVERQLLISDDPPLAKLWGDFEVVLAQLSDLPRRPPPDTDAAVWRAGVTQLREQRHELWGQLKPLIATARKQHSDRLRLLADERYQRVKDARNASGLYWGNYNSVCQSFEVAKGRLAGGDQLRPQEWIGAGRLTNQLQGGFPAATMTGALPGSAAKNGASSEKGQRASSEKTDTGSESRQGHPQVRIEEMPPGHPLLRRGAGRKGRLKLLVATVYSAGRGTRRLAAWPMVMHRDFPPGAVIKTVTIHRRRIYSETGALPGMRREEAVERGERANAETGALPGHAARTGTGSLCSEDPSATQRENIQRRNSDWRWTVSFSCEIPDVPKSTSNLACGVDLGWRIVPDGVRVATVVGSDGGLDHIVLPQKWLDRRVRLSELLGEARVTADNADDDDDRREARRLRRAGNHGIDEANGERREMYRIVAKGLTERYGTLGIDGSGIAKMARRRKAGEPGQDLPPMARRMRTWSAPAELMSEIERAARARGCRVEIAAGPSTITCHHCGAKTEPPDRADLIWQCRNCKRFWDQDENAARNVLAALGTPAPLDIGPRKSKGLRRSRGDRKAVRRDDHPGALPG